MPRTFSVQMPITIAGGRIHNRGHRREVVKSNGVETEKAIRLTEKVNGKAVSRPVEEVLRDVAEWLEGQAKERTTKKPDEIQLNAIAVEIRLLANRWGASQHGWVTGGFLNP
jgi:hypothetical protein